MRINVFLLFLFSFFLFNEGGDGGYKSREEISGFGLNTNDASV